MKVNPIISVLFSAFLFFACSNRPSYVLSESKMENVLYDTYLAEAEISANYTIFSSDSARKQELLNSVLKKHNITEAVLDTSLTWYSGHLEKYFRINENIHKRFAGATEKLRHQEELAAKSNVSPAKRLVLPTEKENFLLGANDLLNNAYTFDADTILSRYGGAYELQFDILGLSASLRPIVTLCAQCSDTTFVKRDTILQNGSFITYVDILRGKQAKKLYGSIYFPEVNSDMNVFIQKFTLSHSNQPRNLPTTQPTKQIVSVGIQK